MPYLRQSLLTICICLYGLIAITLGLSWLFPQIQGEIPERPLPVSEDWTAVSDPGFYSSLPITVELPETALP